MTSFCGDDGSASNLVKRRQAPKRNRDVLAVTPAPGRIICALSLHCHTLPTYGGPFFQFYLSRAQKAQADKVI